MSKNLKIFFKVILTVFLILLGVFVLYICIVLYNANKHYEHYISFCPSNQINTKWICQEEDILYDALEILVP